MRLSSVSPIPSGIGRPGQALNPVAGRYSGQDASPLVAPRMTFRLSNAHLRRVGEMSIPSRSKTHSAPSPVTSSAFIPISSSEAIDAEACDMAQPWPWKRRSVIVPSSPVIRCTPSSSPQRGLWSWCSRSWGSSVPKFRGFL